MPLQDRYRRALAEHGYAPDPAQEAAVERLEALRLRVAEAAGAQRTLLRRFRARLGTAPAGGIVRGAYLWGGVGRGKTFLMDLFHGALDVPSRRSHFHRFMQDVHARLQALREKGLEDPLRHVAADLAREARVLCLDELHVDDIADPLGRDGQLAAAAIEQGGEPYPAGPAVVEQKIQGGTHRAAGV